MGASNVKRVGSFGEFTVTKQDEPKTVGGFYTQEESKEVEQYAKDHFVIIEAIGGERSQKTDSRPLEKKSGMSLKDLLQNVAMGNTQEEILRTLANRLIRLDKQINETEKSNLAAQAEGFTSSHVVRR